jgi:cold shock CspA family protein
MGKSQETYNKKEKEKKRLKKRQDKLAKKEERKANSDGGGLENMMAYVDENGMIVDTPPDPAKKTKIKASNIELGVPKKEESDEPTEKQGKVAFYNDSKGYGFINDLNSQEKYFFHVNGLIDEVTENDKVTFEVERGLKGMNAVRVKKV